MLMARGYIVYHTRVGWASGVDMRANDLKQALRRLLNQTGARKINIIAHSMGGLDARHMMFNDRNETKIHKSIASLTTISTPHEGSPLADWGLTHLPRLPETLLRIGLDVNGLTDLRTENCKRFNNDPAVIAFETECESETQFHTYAGTQSFWGVFSLLKGAFKIIQSKEGENDGLVSVRSARWRDRYFQTVINETDHLNEIGLVGHRPALNGRSSARLSEPHTRLLPKNCFAIAMIRNWQAPAVVHRRWPEWRFNFSSFLPLSHKFLLDSGNRH